VPNPEDNNAFELGVSGTITNNPPKPTELEVKRHLLEEATKLLARLQDELQGCRRRLIEQEQELMQLREELNKPEG